MIMDTQRLVFNGIHGATGDYLAPPLTLDELVASLRRRPRRSRAGGKGLAFGDPDDLAQAGWGVVFPRDSDPAVVEALRPLIELRRGQASAAKECRFRVFAGDDGLLPGESKLDFLYRVADIGPGMVEPDKMPYYLLLAGGPEQIPYELQYQLDVQHAVGRLAFDAPWEYAQYAESAVAADHGRVRRPRRAAILATRNPGDDATALASEHLAGPLGAGLTERSVDGWEVSTAVGDGAGKADFARHLGGESTPALLFTAGHGLGWDAGDPGQRSFQGALVCQDWPGPGARGPVHRDCYFAAGDVASTADVAGLVAFFFACYGAGTPALDDFDRSVAGRTRSIAPAPLVARLPQRLLSHPRGAALAVVGHVERAWTYSFMWGRQAQIGLFDKVLRELLLGRRIGAAMELFAHRLGEMATELVAALDRQERGGKLDEKEAESLVRLWNAHHDARNYVVLGDPAVRLAVGNGGGGGRG
jgi:hypothetical protein